jgi:hypothetical protein
MTEHKIAKTEVVPISTLKFWDKNPRSIKEERFAELKDRLLRLGQIRPLVATHDGTVIGGNMRLRAMHELGYTEVSVTRNDASTDMEIFDAALTDNEEFGYYEKSDLTALALSLHMTPLQLDSYEINLGGTTTLSSLLAEEEAADDEEMPSLAEKFIVPPFSVLDTKQGYWQERKRAWIRLGIQSELGRGGEDGMGSIGGNGASLGAGLQAKKGKDGKLEYAPILKRQATALTFRGATGKDDFMAQKMADAGGGTSIFDPVLCEISYRWFNVPDGSVLDPFAGGSVRGIVASKLGYNYTGHELRIEQVQANREQAEILIDEQAAAEVIETLYAPDDLTPIEKHADIYVKRDDLCSIAGVRGGKVRTCWQLSQGASHLVTAGARQSPQVNIVAHIARHVGAACDVFVPEGSLTPESAAAEETGATINRVKAGYNNVIKARARDFAKEHNATHIPFGMECQEAVDATAQQVRDIPADVKRIVIPVGSGMSFCGLLKGLADQNLSIPVLGIQVGADPIARIDKFAPGWQDRAEITKSDLEYADHATNTHLGNLKLDPTYEAKCLPFLEPGDLLWVVGIKQTETEEYNRTPMPIWIEGDSNKTLDLVATKHDMIFSCPPYADLEVYSKDPDDLSNMPYDQFREMYRSIIAKSCARLNDDRFAVFVVGEVRSKTGEYYDFVGDTIKAFRDAGLHYYNEIILVSAIGSLPMRAARTFNASRKIGKGHQNVLVFYKGNIKNIKTTFQPLDFSKLAELMPENKEEESAE